jgi:hypothetical protein
MWRIFKTAHNKVSDFREGRTRQSDLEFFCDCGIEADTEAARIALAVRRAVAGIGLVDPLFVQANDSYPGRLELLPLWDSMDWLSLECELVRELGQPPPPNFRPWTVFQESGLLTVRGLVTRLREALDQSTSPGKRGGSLTEERDPVEDCWTWVQ